MNGYCGERSLGSLCIISRICSSGVNICAAASQTGYDGSYSLSCVAVNKLVFLDALFSM